MFPPPQTTSRIGRNEENHPGLVAAYGFAMAITILATIVPMIFKLFGNYALFFVPYFPAILFSTLFGGVGPGILALVLAIVLEWWVFLFPEFLGSATPDIGQSLQLVTYAVAASFVIWIAEAYRQALHQSQEEETKRRLYLGEIQHRVRNMMTIVQSIVSQALRGNRDAIERVNGRIAALVATNDLLSRSEDLSADLKNIILAELEPYGRARISLSGETQSLPSGVAVAFALVIHELATNAVKHGALSQKHGRVHISWQVQEDCLTLEWIESGGPPVAAPVGQGLGTPLIKRLVKSLRGASMMDFQPSGLVCKMVIDLPPNLEVPRRAGPIIRVGQQAGPSSSKLSDQISG